MIIKKIKLSNVRSYKDEEIVFPQGSILLSGDIGSGKTSVLLAIEFALFGLQPGQKGSSILSNGEDSGSVTLHLQIEENDVIIERGIKRGTKSISQEACAITINGERSELSVTELKTKILQLLNYPGEFVKKTNLLYKYTVYTPQEEMKQIILDDVDSRLNILRHIFGIDKYKKIRDNLSILVAKIREESRVLQGETNYLAEIKESFSNLQESSKILEGKAKEKAIEWSKKREVRKSLEEELKGIAEKLRERGVFENEIDKTTIMLSGKMDQLKREENEMASLEKELSKSGETFDEEKLISVLEEISAKKKLLDELNMRHVAILSRIDSIKSRISEDSQKRNRIFAIDLCPTCLQNVSDAYKHNIINEMEQQISKSEREIKELTSDLKKANSLMETEKNSLVALEKKKSDMEFLRIRTKGIILSKEKIENLKRSKESLEKDIQFLRDHVIVLKNSIFEFSKFDNLHRAKEDELKKAFNEEKNIEISIAQIKREIELQNKEIARLKKKISEMESKKEKLEYLQDLEKWLSGDFINLVEFTERNIMIKLREDFSKLFNNWFSILTTDSFYVHLDENFTPIIVQGDYELEYSHLSGGERTAVALAYRLALNQIVGSLLSRIRTKDLIILDEPTDGFSDHQLVKVRDILQELNARQLILVSHEQKIESFVDNVIRFKKESGESKVVSRTSESEIPEPSALPEIRGKTDLL